MDDVPIPRCVGEYLGMLRYAKRRRKNRLFRIRS